MPRPMFAMLLPAVVLLAGTAGPVAQARQQPDATRSSSTPASAVGAPRAVPVYGRIAPTADGIGKTYEGREISQVMGWQRAAWLEREEREREERVSVLLRELRLVPGMAVADIGAGTGYHVRRIAPLVGVTGRVFAVDVQPQMVARLQALAKQPGMSRVVAVQGTAEDPRLAPASIDLALMVDVYHELEFPHEMLQRVVRALKPGGRLVLVEYRAEDAGVPIKPLHKMGEAQIRREVGRHALRWERTADTLPWQHVVVFRKAAAVATPAPATR